MIQDLFLKLAWPNWLFTLTVIALAAIAYIYYYRTLPPLSKPRRLLMIVLRGASLIIALFLILEPILNLAYRLTEKPVVAVLADNSASMNIRENYGRRGDSLNHVLNLLDQVPGLDSVDIQMFPFALNIESLSGDTMAFKTDGSNIYQALRSVADSLSGSNLQSIVLLSDGVYNQGPNPNLVSRHLAAPVYSVMVGDSSLPRDVAVRRLRTSQVTYVNKTLPIETVIWHNGYDGQRALVTVLQNGRQVAQQSVRLGKSGFEQKIEMEIVAKTAGDFTYQVRVQAMPGEVTLNNNRQSVQVQVLKSKIKVLAVSGSPNYDRHFLSFIGEQLPDYQLTFLTEKSSGRFFENEFSSIDLDSQDVIILQGFPTRQTDAGQLQNLMTAIESRKLPVIWFTARSSDFSKLQAYSDRIPFQPENVTAPLENQFVRLSTGGISHPVTRLEDDETANGLLWKELPPVEVYPRIKFRGGGQVLLELTNAGSNGRGLSGLTVCYAYRQSGAKHLVFNAANFGNWHFQLQDDPQRDRFMLRFLERAIRWAVNRDDIQQIQIRPLQRLYNVGEPVTFSGQVYDAFYQQINDARVVVRLQQDTLNLSDEMIAEGGGFYRQTFSGLPEGRFNYVVEAYREEERIGQRRGSFTVQPFFLEYQETAANYGVLRRLSDETGGRVFRPAEFLRSFSSVNLESRVLFSNSEYLLWNYWYWLMALVAFLGTEWFFRKRWGLL